MDNQIKVIIAGEMAAGKTSLCDYLKEQHHASVWMIAEMIKNISHALVDHNGDLEDYLENVFPDKEIRKKALQEFLRYSSTYERESGKPRKLYQDIGEIGRKIDLYCWEEELYNRLQKSPSGFIIIDVRAKEGFNFFTSRGFKSIKLTAPLEIRKRRLLARDGFIPDDSVFTHVSETEIASFPTDYLIVNETDDLKGPIQELNHIVQELNQF